jgi:chromosome segregation ATPase
LPVAFAVEAVQKKFESEKSGEEEGQDELHGEFFGLGDVSRLSRRLSSLGSELNRIDREIELSRQALDQALSAYNELQMALPLHRKYKETIKALEKYRNKVSDIRKEVDLYPVTFLDVTTTQCT